MVIFVKSHLTTSSTTYVTGRGGIERCDVSSAESSRVITPSSSPTVVAPTLATKTASPPTMMPVSFPPTPVPVSSPPASVPTAPVVALASAPTSYLSVKW